jgi:hypothetical protein
MALKAGDVAFVQIGTTDPDEFSFVAIKDIAAGEVIVFTDNGWLATGTFRSGEGTLVYTVPVGGLQAGKVVSWLKGSTDKTDVGFSSGSPLIDLAGTKGDSLIAFQGTLGAPTALIAAVQTKNSGTWNSEATSSNTSAVPGTGYVGTTEIPTLTVLTPGIYSVTLNGTDSFFTKNSVPTITSDNALSKINDSNNWTINDGDQTTQYNNYTFTALCYLAGTHIHTPSAERRIETLAIGDEITTIDGTQRLRWIGRHSYPRAVAGPWVSPIRISTDAFGQGLPHRDLLVSPWHAILLGDVLVRAADLVNGSTITQIFPGMVVHYLNLEFDAPTVVYAEGVAAETYANHANRHMFENAAEYTALYGDDERVMIDAAGNNLRRFPIVFDGPRFQDALRRANAHRRYA